MAYHIDHNTAWHLPPDTRSQIPVVTGVAVTVVFTVFCFWQNPFVKSLNVKGRP